MTSKNDNVAATPHALTVTQLTRRWSCDRVTVTKAIAEGRLRAFKLGLRTWRITIDEVRRFERESAA